jgi:hypothetical protein
MSDFFKQEMVLGEMQEMAELHQFCMRSMMSFPVLSYEKKKEYFDTMLRWIEKQKLFYVRTSCSDDPEAKQFAESMRDAVMLLGGDPEKKDVLGMLDALTATVNACIEKLEAEGG